jgi:hypothetical protein
MGNLKHLESGHSAVARKADGNPEGKGLNGFLLDWYQSEPRGVVAKSQRQVLAELFTSMLVLSASFKFRPAVGTPNYLSSTRHDLDDCSVRPSGQGRPGLGRGWSIL